jgi:hypothetical protein
MDLFHSLSHLGHARHANHDRHSPKLNSTGQQSLLRLIDAAVGLLAGGLSLWLAPIPFADLAVTLEP